MNEETDRDIFSGYGVIVELTRDDSFLIIMETLKRIGVPSMEKKKLFQSTHILHKQGEYAILHFKELFGLDGRPCNMTMEDVQRRNRIAQLLEEWGLVKIIDKDDLEDGSLDLNRLKILSHADAKSWTLEQKYPIGKKRS